MNEPSHRMNLNQRADQELDTAHQSRPETSIIEFKTAEEILRHDAAIIEVPQNLALRLAESARQSPPVPWWKRLFTN